MDKYKNEIFKLFLAAWKKTSSVRIQSAHNHLILMGYTAKREKRATINFIVWLMLCVSANTNRKKAENLSSLKQQKDKQNGMNKYRSWACCEKEKKYCFLIAQKLCERVCLDKWCWHDTIRILSWFAFFSPFSSFHNVHLFLSNASTLFTLRLINMCGLLIKRLADFEMS